ncbi:MAG: xanthine dehydrogenase family protein molybdopterin-binding subunit [Armatimonadota bacterium]|nr:xanthine dehydrogenase family protein molybdopterin-binding subunit [Armatimonadota bacterium]
MERERLSWIGKPLKRREDPRLLQGQGKFVDDIVLPGMVHMVVVRSPFAHARIGGIRGDTALQVPGVLGVITGKDLAGRVHPMPINPMENARIAPVPHPLLAMGKVRYMGEPVAAILAETKAAAEDAVYLVEVAYDPLPALVDPIEALSSQTFVHDELGENVLLQWSREGGDVEGAFRKADHVVKGRFHIPRLIAAPLEPRGAVAAYDPGTDTITVWCSAQDPHRPRAQLSRILGRPEDRIRIIIPEVGGAFGSKGHLAPEVALAAFLAMHIRRPVKWVEDRRENFQAAYQGRGMEAEVEMAVTRDGRFLGVRARLIADLGAYLYPATALVPVTTAMLLTGTYDIPNAAVELIGVATNKVPTGPYRGAGRPEAAYLVERMVDLAADELGIDPVEIRRRNFIPSDRFPYTTPLGFVYDSGNYEQALDRALELAEYPRWREEQAKARDQGRLLGIGIAAYVERAGSQLWEGASVRVEPNGRVLVRTGSSPHGQGHETIFSQIAAEALQIDPGTVVVEHGDSAIVPRGVGTFGSRSTTVGGSAVWVALEKIKAKATKIAAYLLEASEEDISWENGRLFVRGSPDRALTFAQVAATAYQPGRLPPGMEMGLEAAGVFCLPGPVFPFGVYVAIVEIERETGEVRVLKVVAVDDAGRIVNPMLAEGQVIGATVQGLGQALLEEAVYDESGQLLTGSFADYGVLHATQVPEVVTDLLETPSPLNPLGAKGIGEAGSIATPAAVANAVMDALAPLGIRHLDFPFTPERLWRLIHAGSR